MSIIKTKALEFINARINAHSGKIKSFKEYRENILLGLKDQNLKEKIGCLNNVLYDLDKMIENDLLPDANLNEYIGKKNYLYALKCIDDGANKICSPLDICPHISGWGLKSKELSSLLSEICNFTIQFVKIIYMKSVISWKVKNSRYFLS